MYRTPKIVLWLLLTISIVAVVEASEHDGIKSYIKDYLSIYDTRREVSLALVPDLIEYSKQYNIDPWLVAVTISMESSWVQSAMGSAGEQGLTQVHGFCARGADLSTGKGQILAGVKCIAHAQKKCNNTLNVINAYFTGKCAPVIKRAKLRYREYKRIKRKYGE